MSQEEIIKLHPSLCYQCIHARKPASDEIQNKGYVGCAEYARSDNGNIEFVGDVKELAEGWVDLRAKIFGIKSGVITNLQLLTLEVKECKSFLKKDS